MVWRTVIERAVSVFPERRLFEDIGFSEGICPARQKLELPRRIALRTPLHSISFRLPQSSLPNDFVVLVSCFVKDSGTRRSGGMADALDSKSS